MGQGLGLLTVVCFVWIVMLMSLSRVAVLFGYERKKLYLCIVINIDRVMYRMVFRGKNWALHVCGALCVGDFHTPCLNVYVGRDFMMGNGSLVVRFLFLNISFGFVLSRGSHSRLG